MSSLSPVGRTQSLVYNDDPEASEPIVLFDDDPDTAEVIDLYNDSNETAYPSNSEQNLPAKPPTEEDNDSNLNSSGDSNLSSESEIRERCNSLKISRNAPRLNHDCLTLVFCHLDAEKLLELEKLSPFLADAVHARIVRYDLPPIVLTPDQYSIIHQRIGDSASFAFFIDNDLEKSAPLDNWEDLVHPDRYFKGFV